MTPGKMHKMLESHVGEWKFKSMEIEFTKIID